MEQLTDTDENSRMSESDPVIQVSNIEKGFGTNQVLKGINLTHNREEILLLMGPNGVGKSVFMSCLANSTEPDVGTIELFGEWEPADARSAISVMLQGKMADPDLTGRENLQFYQSLHPNGTDYWEELLNLFELVDDIDRPVREYSGGMVRKLEIAITLSADVPLYMLDEPTAEMDLAMIRVLHDIILDNQSDGKSFLITSHAPLDAQIADRIVFVNDGRIVANDQPDRLLEALPAVVRVRGAVPPEERLLGQRLFQRGDEIRGFLPEDVGIDTIESELEETDTNVYVDIDPPSYTDLFNYQVYVGSDHGEQ